MVEGSGLTTEKDMLEKWMKRTSPRGVQRRPRCERE
jgi:hypothetical protein